MGLYIHTYVYSIQRVYVYEYICVRMYVYLVFTFDNNPTHVRVPGIYIREQPTSMTQQTIMVERVALQISSLAIYRFFSQFPFFPAVNESH